MKNINKRAFSEVIDVLNHSEKEIIEKIPKKLMKFLSENSDTDYKPNIDYTNDNWEDKLDEDANVLLAMIYRDYIVSEAERINLIKNEKEEIKEKEMELRKKYNPDVFSNIKK